MLVQIVRVDDDERVHVAQVGCPKSRTLCDEHSTSLGAMLPFNEALWPDQVWCKQCRAAYRDASQRHMQ